MHISFPCMFHRGQNILHYIFCMWYCFIDQLITAIGKLVDLFLFRMLAITLKKIEY